MKIPNNPSIEKVELYKRSNVETFFIYYSLIEFMITSSSILRDLLRTCLFKIICSRKKIFTDDQNKLSEHLAQSNKNLFVAIFGCFHLLAFPILARKNYNLYSQYMDKGNDSFAKKYLKKLKLFNNIFFLLFILSQITISIGISLFLYYNFFQNEKVEICNKNDEYSVSVYSAPYEMFQVNCRSKSLIIFQRAKLNGYYIFHRNLTYTNYQNIYRSDFANDPNIYWIGLDNLYNLLNSNEFALKIRVKNVWYYFDQFKIKDKSEGYRLELGTVSNYSTSNNLKFEDLNYIDFRIFNGMKFSTFDNDQDNDRENNCAEIIGEGWWYNKCKTSQKFIKDIEEMSIFFK